MTPSSPPRQRRLGYRYGVQWIAENDEPDVLDVDMVSGMVSVMLLADLFRKDQDDVAAAVVRYREKHS